MRQYIASNVPDDLLSAARIDGCSEWGVYWQIVMPVIRPALGALGILLLIGTWNNLLWAFIVLRTEDMYTLPLLIYLLKGETETPWGNADGVGVARDASVDRRVSSSSSAASSRHHGRGGQAMKT